MRPRLITKFGGTSLATRISWEAVLEILEERRGSNPLVVVSAVGAVPGRPKVTDLLFSLAKQALDGEAGGEGLPELRSLHSELLDELKLPSDLLDGLWQGLEEQLAALRDAPPARDAALDRVVGWGERLSAAMMAEALRRRGVDARACTPDELGLVTDDRFQNASVLEQSLEDLARNVIRSREELVVPGYLGTTRDGRPTTLGRGGSDYTAAVLGAALKRDVEIWTDVDGVAITNPAIFDSSMRAEGHPRTIAQLSHEEAYQMAAFGSRVLYEKCLSAARMAARKGRHLRLIVKNTFNPGHPGTVLAAHRAPDGLPKGITALEEVQLLTVYLDREEDYRGLLEDVGSIEDSHLLMASYSTGRASFVFDRLSPALEERELRYPDAHLSRDQVLIKVVGDGMGANHASLARIHQAVDFIEDPERYGAPLLHKSPQLLTDSTFEFVARKRGARQVILQLYKDLFGQAEIHVGMLGLGTVGGGVLYYSRELYSREKTGCDLHFPVALVRDLKKARPNFAGRLTDQAEQVVSDPRVDVVVELMGGLEPARTLILTALAQGKHVVTANKAVLAEYGHEIFAAARKHRRNLGFEASVCGEIPVIEVVLGMPSSQDAEAITGILNGTSNYLLTQMDGGMNYDQALRMAQEAGFAEADPTLDVSGADATQKLSILASLVFHSPVPWKEIYCEGIDRVKAVDTAVARQSGYRFRPVAHARRTAAGLVAWVGPALVDADHSLYAVSRETNAVSLSLRERGEPFTLVGKGAGALPTARSVLRDILDIARKARHKMVELPAFHEGKRLRLVDPGDHVYPWWVRFTVEDVPGVFARIATALGSRALSIRQASQHDPDEEGGAHIMLMLKAAERRKLSEALDEIRSGDYCRSILAVPVLESGSEK
ncbi:MAG: homoserine dehydrogenase [Armatimonadetes bacterium]|nr:homoserine dehydrogenase [Armatimonadota bacterium]